MFSSLKKSNMVLSAITFLLFCSVLFAAAYAFPQQPTNFYGYVFLGADENNATTGTNITAKIASTVFSSTLTTDGNFYSFLVPTDDSGTATKEGATTADNISLFVIDIYSNSWVFIGPGYSNRLDLYINRPPVLETISDISITETDTATITPTATDADSDTITYTINDTDKFTWSDPSFTWTTGYDNAGVYTVRVTATDSAMSDYQDITVTVSDKNRAPTASDDTTSTAEDTAKDITLSATDADGDGLTYSVVANPTYGTVSISGTIATYTPDDNYNGEDSFTFKANDGAADSNTATVTITVSAVNDAPTATSESVSTAEDTAKAITLSATDIENDDLTYSIVSSPAHGTLSGSIPTLTYTPDSNYFGGDTFTFKANDGAADSNTATVTITVTAVNDAPTATSESVTTAEDTAKAMTLNATDIESSSLTYSIVSAPSNGVLSGTAPSITYTPNANYFGGDTFTFKANDGAADSNTATVTITVSAVNDAPTISPPVTDITTPEDTDATLDLTQFENDVEDSDTSLTWSISGENTAIFTASIDSVTDILTITPVTNANGADTVTLTLTDSGAATATQDITVTVSTANDAPVAADDSLTTTEDTAKDITLTATDADGDSLTYALVTGPTKGAVIISGTTATYTPDSNYYGADSFTFNANDGTVNSTEKTITITVTAVNDAPTATSESVTTAEDTAKAITLNATDIEGSPLTYSIVSAPSNGILSGTAPSVTYTPNANYNGADSFTFNVNDGTVNSTIAATITISVTAVNDAPVLATISDISVFERQKITVTPSATDVDVDSLTFTANNSNLTWNETSNAFEWTPDYLDSSNYTITITVSDTVLEDTQTFNIEVKDKYHAFERDLALGWNLVSFPYVLDNASIDDVLSSIDGNYNVVWSYNTSVEGDWPRYNPAFSVSSQLNTLKDLENIQGFWINMTASDTLTVVGTIPVSTTINLNQGWNLISYPFDDSAEISCMLSQVAGNYTVLWQYNETAQGADYDKWTLNNPDAPSQVNTLDNFTKGYGYWINMTEVETLEWTSTC